MDNTGQSGDQTPATTANNSSGGSVTFTIPGAVQTGAPNAIAAGNPGSSSTTSGAPSRVVPADFSTYQARVFAIRELRDFVQHLVGDMLTIIDASVINPQQNRALKSLFKRAAWDDHYTKALEWAERQIEVEYRALAAWDEYRNSQRAATSASEGPFPVAPQTWKDVDEYLRRAPLDTFNVFPFSRTPGQEPVDERAADPR